MKHLDFIRSLPCILCGDNTSTEAAHIRYADANYDKPITGMGTKSDDKYTVPLCGRHHRKQHTMGERKFWQFFGIDPIFISLCLHKLTGDYRACMELFKAWKLGENRPSLC